MDPVVSVRLSDLPESVRRQVEAAAGVKRKAPKKRGSEAVVGWCGYCWEPIGSAPAMDRHRDATGHSRFQVFPPPPRSIP